MKVLFLDIDGVCNTDYTKERTPIGFTGIEQKFIKELKYIVENTDALICLSSTWRYEVDCSMKSTSKDGQYLIDCLNKEGLSLFSKTTTIYDKDPRGAEIVNFLETHKGVEGYVIVDDVLFRDFKPLGLLPHLIKTNPKEGLDKVRSDLAIRVLNGEIRMKEVYRLKFEEILYETK